ncbi:MAG: DUF1287 domain-containing protein [Solobacterium sp.]|nr:DUF1287 domain-containing protein [Solobacterium sp.]
MKKKMIAAAVLVIALCVISSLLSFRTSAARPKNGYEGAVISDSKILEEALRYVGTCPKYKSRYYHGGYPDDGYGTCTDVIGFALRSSGYDLRKKLNEDVLAHPERYEIETPDIDIDFRRVKNLIVYFENNEEVLGNDLSQIQDWQGGDLVIFRNHIGIVSDRRNAKGIPYVIHHASPFQLRYEEDILEKRDDLVLHIRVKTDA